MKKFKKLFRVTFVVTLLVVLFFNTAYTQYNAVNSFNVPFVSDINQQPSAKNIMQKAGKDIVFIENLGQIQDMKRKKRPDILFLVRSQGVDMYITKSGISYIFRNTEGSIMNLNRAGNTKSRYHRLDMEFVGMNKNFKIKKEIAVEQKYNYYTPEYPDGIFPKGYKKITLENIYEGIDLVYYERNNKMKYDFVVKAAANPDDIKMKYKRAGKIYLDLDGSVVVTTPLGEIREERPLTYSKITGRTIESGYCVNDNLLSFKIADYEKSEEIIIDPYLKWAAYFGGDGSEEGLGICTDKDNNLYITGGTTSDNFIPVDEYQHDGVAHNQISLRECVALFCKPLDAFILKFDKNGVLKWVTYYGGHHIDYGTAICADNSGNLYVTGCTWSSPNEDIGVEEDDKFPRQRHSNENAFYQPSFNYGCYNAFILKFNNDGVRQWATWYGGNGGTEKELLGGIGGNRGEVGNSICVDNEGNLYVAGSTYSTENLILERPDNGNPYYQSSYGGDMDAFILKFNEDCELVWGTYFGGSGKDFVGTPYCEEISCGITIEDWEDFFENLFNPDLCKKPEYWGGNGICTDKDGNLYVTGETSSSSIRNENGEEVIPKTPDDVPNADSYAHAGGKDAFILKYNSDCELVWSTYYGGAVDEDGGIGEEGGRSICIDECGNFYITGETNSTDLPTKAPDAYDPENANLVNSFSDELYGGKDVFILKFSKDCDLEWATYYGGSGNDYGKGICVDFQGFIYVTGYTESDDFTTKRYNWWGDEYDDDLNDQIIKANDDTYNNTCGSGYICGDIFILSYSRKGNLFWSTYYGGDNLDYGLNICVDERMYIYITGVTRSSEGFNTQVQHYRDEGETDIFMLKCNEDRDVVPYENSWPKAIYTSGITPGDIFVLQFFTPIARSYAICLILKETFDLNYDCRDPRCPENN